MITGIGTPNSHNNIPRPILVSSTTSIESAKHQSKGERVSGRLVPAREAETARAEPRYDFGIKAGARF
jgi:hypothetical protein